MLLGSVSVCRAPISIFTSLSFKERKVTGLSYVELSSLLNFPSRTTWRKTTRISVSESTAARFQSRQPQHTVLPQALLWQTNTTAKPTHRSPKSHSQPTRNTKTEMRNKAVSLLPQTLWFQNDEGEVTRTVRCESKLFLALWGLHRF